MKKTHQIGLMTALFASVALTTFAQDQVQSSPTPASSDAAFRLSDAPGSGLSTGNLSNAYDWAFDGCLQPDNPVRDLRLTPLGVQVAYSFGL